MNRKDDALALQKNLKKDYRMKIVSNMKLGDQKRNSRLVSFKK